MIENLINFYEVFDFDFLEPTKVRYELIWCTSDEFEGYWDFEIFVGSIKDPIVFFDFSR